MRAAFVSHTHTGCTHTHPGDHTHVDTQHTHTHGTRVARHSDMHMAPDRCTMHTRLWLIPHAFAWVVVACSWHNTYMLALHHDMMCGRMRCVLTHAPADHAHTMHTPTPHNHALTVRHWHAMLPHMAQCMPTQPRCPTMQHNAHEICAMQLTRQPPTQFGRPNGAWPRGRKILCLK